MPILIDSTNLLDTIESGTKVARASANLTLDETLQIASATQSLVTIVQETLSTIISAKPKFNAILAGGLILLNLKEEKSETDKFSAAIIEKIPTAFQGLAQNIVAPIDTAFNEAIAEYV